MLYYIYFNGYVFEHDQQFIFYFSYFMYVYLGEEYTQ